LLNFFYLPQGFSSREEMDPCTMRRRVSTRAIATAGDSRGALAAIAGAFGTY